MSRAVAAQAVSVDASHSMSGTAHSGAALAWPPKLPPPGALTDELVAGSPDCCLVDAIHPGRPALVCFAGGQGPEAPHFDFFHEGKKLERLSGQALNRVLLRDPFELWYQWGVPGLGSTVDETAGLLRLLLQALAPSRVITIGQSKGAYAALMFGALVGADRVVAFGPMSSLEIGFACSIDDGRWLPALDALRALQASGARLDLPALWRETKHRPELRIHYGLTDGPRLPGGRNLDAYHALRLAALPRCKAMAHGGAPHEVVHFLRKRRQLDALLMKDVLDLPLAFVPPPQAPCAPLPSRSGVL